MKEDRCIHLLPREQCALCQNKGGPMNNPKRDNPHTVNLCKIPWCTNAVAVRGLCKRCYNSWNVNAPEYVKILGPFFHSRGGKKMSEEDVKYGIQVGDDLADIEGEEKVAKAESWTKDILSPPEDKPWTKVHPTPHMYKFLRRTMLKAELIILAIDAGGDNDHVKMLAEEIADALKEKAKTTIGGPGATKNSEKDR